MLCLVDFGVDFVVVDFVVVDLVVVDLVVVDLVADLVQRDAPSS